MQIAELTNTPYSLLLGGMGDEESFENLTIRDRMFREEHMFTRIKAFAAANHFDETYKVLPYMREQHAGQLRKQGRYTAKQVLYINHPLLMTCQAMAFGVRDDTILAAMLLHDVVEDTSVTVESIPFSDEVKEIVGLVSFSPPAGKDKMKAKQEYCKAIVGNGKACVVKIVDRCNNVSTMAASFSKKKMAEYISETEEYVLPFTSILKNQYPEYSDLVFLAK